MLEELLLREEDFVEDAQLLGLSSDNEDWWTGGLTRMNMMVLRLGLPAEK
jgi:hypothetical protein